MFQFFYSEIWKLNLNLWPIFGSVCSIFLAEFICVKFEWSGSQPSWHFHEINLADVEPHTHNFVFQQRSNFKRVMLGVWFEFFIIFSKCQTISGVVSLSLHLLRSLPSSCSPFKMFPFRFSIWHFIKLFAVHGRILWVYVAKEY